MSRRALQVVNALIGIATAGLGSVQLAFGVDSPLYASANLPQFPVLDSNLRFFGGMGLGIGLALLWIVPSIERQASVFRVVWICAFLGGVGRLVSAALAGVPSQMLMAFTILEVVGAPVLIYWQNKVAAST
jgi:hypothetical protein